MCCDVEFQHDSEHEAVAAWNNRPGEAQARREAFREVLAELRRRIYEASRHGKTIPIEVRTLCDWLRAEAGECGGE